MTLERNNENGPTNWLRHVIAFLILGSIVSTAALAAPPASRFVFGGKGHKMDSGKTIVIVFTHGSRGNASQDPCIFTSKGSFLNDYVGGFRMPRILRNLAKRDKRVALFYVCHGRSSSTLGDKGSLTAELHRKIPCRREKSGKGASTARAKICKRMAKIEREIAILLKSNTSLKKRNIFLAGTSAGGWASLLLNARLNSIGRLPYAGTIAFAPGTNGQLGRALRRSKGRTQTKTMRCGTGGPKPVRVPINAGTGRYLRHTCQTAYIAAYAKKAIAFSFVGDPFNSPPLLKPFAKARGIEFYAVARKHCGKGKPLSNHPHSCAQERRFSQEYLPILRKWMAKRLAR